MGFLDELEQEAERRRKELARSTDSPEERERIWNEQLGPAMVELAEYLRKLTENLRFLQRPGRFCHELPGYGPVVAYAKPEQYHLRSTRGVTKHEIELTCIARISARECPIVVLEGTTRVRALETLFTTQHLSGIEDVHRNSGGDPVSARFHARGRVPQRVLVQADWDSCVARMEFHNIERFGCTTRSFVPEQLTPELFDALGRFITGEAAEFAREGLPEDVRQQLRSRIEREQAKRECEQRIARQLEDDERRVRATMAGDGGVFGRLRALSARLRGR